MSRVFEALARAGEEKHGQVQRPVEKVESTVTGRDAHRRKRVNPRTILEQTVRSVKPTVPSMKLTNYIRRSRTVKNRGAKKLKNGSLGWDLRRYSSYPIVALETESPASEQYKMLREQVKRLRAESGIRSFSISSPVKRDGKTTVAVNLAAALSLDYEEKVLLIDGDLRAPSIHRYFNALESPGLADYLACQLENEAEESGTGDLCARVTHFAFRETIAPRIRAFG